MRSSLAIRPHRLMVRTPPFHGGNTGSNPVGVTIQRKMNFIIDLAKQIKNHPASRQLVKFLIIGTIGTIISYSTFLLLLNVFHLHYLISNALAFIIGVSFGYYFNSKWSFDAKNSKLFQSFLFSLYLVVPIWLKM